MRRQKTLEKYQRDADEKNKIEEEVKQKLAEEKLARHKEKLDKIHKNAEERSAMIKASDREFKKIEKVQPLYVKYQEKFDQEIESQELAKQKKALEDKRNFVNQVPAGGFKRAFGEHEVNYQKNKDRVEAELAKKREEEQIKMKNHYGSLKYKPKRIDISQQLNSPKLDMTRNKEGASSLQTSVDPAMHNRFLEDIR